ncbi:MAG: methyltransferase domain-containing protein [Acidimicrobiales bacterium]
MENTIDRTTLDQLVDRAFGDFAAAMTLPLVRLGDRLGMYRALRDHGRTTAAELAVRCGLPEPIAREWLANQAAAGYVTVDGDDATFWLTPEQAAVFADEDSGACMLAAFQLAAAYTRSEPTLAEAIRGGEPCAWGDHDPELFDAVERFYRPAYTAALVPEWIPALEGVEPRLRDGCSVADVGCGHGLSTVLMAKAFPASRFVGIDDHPASIDRARRLAADEGVDDGASFEVRPAAELDGAVDLICVLDAFHDMGEPDRVAARLRDHLTPSGVCMIVEPFAGDRLADNLSPLGRAYYAASTLACTPSALSQSDAPPLGAQAGPARLIATLEAGGFRTVRVAATTPFNLVLEARP